MPTSGSKLPENPPAHDKDTDHRLQLSLDPPAYNKDKDTDHILQLSLDPPAHKIDTNTRIAAVSETFSVKSRSFPDQQARTTQLGTHISRSHFQITFPDQQAQTTKLGTHIAVILSTSKLATMLLHHRAQRSHVLLCSGPPAIREWCLFGDIVTSCEGNREEHIFHTCAFPGQQGSTCVTQVVLIR